MTDNANNEARLCSVSRFAFHFLICIERKTARSTFRFRAPSGFRRVQARPSALKLADREASDAEDTRIIPAGSELRPRVVHRGKEFGGSALLGTQRAQRPHAATDKAASPWGMALRHKVGLTCNTDLDGGFLHRTASGRCGMNERTLLYRG